MCAKRTFTKINKLLSEEIPAGLEYILENAGFDSLNSISSITEEDILEIEKYTNENKEVLGQTTYSIPANEVFKLKPGHKKFLLNLPTALKKKQKESEEKVKQKEPVRRQNRQLIEINENVRIGETVREQQIQIIDINENAEIQETKLKEQLINKVVNFSLKFNVQITFDEDLNTTISQYHREGDIVRCKINCPFVCTAKYSCLYNKYWMISSFESHLKKHFVKLNGQETESEEIQEKENKKTAPTSLQTVTHTDKIVCISEEQNSALNQILTD